MLYVDLGDGIAYDELTMIFLFQIVVAFVDAFVIPS